jgi:hypothetical protein
MKAEIAKERWSNKLRSLNDKREERLLQVANFGKSGKRL